MNKFVLNTLVLGDDDLHCKTGEVNLSMLNLSHTNFTGADLDKYDLIVYQGSKGCKILKSRAFRIGKVN
jgi:uncharacterized protein YjbI with pentapeptide repeats